jgi:uncharacterized protein YjbJ (UPF0337 family)
VNEERMTGSAKDLAGQAEAAYGRAAGDVRHELQGKARQAEGAVQEFHGQVKDQAARAAETIEEGMSRADDFVP